MAVGIAALGVGAVAIARQSSIGRQSELAVGYAARTVCACRYLGNRSLGSCRTDFEPGMEAVRLSEDRQARRITATVPLLATRSARHRPGYGCTLEQD